MAATSTKDTHIRAILEFYKAGYITTAEKNKLVAKLYKAKAPLLRISTEAEGRELCYLYVCQRRSKQDFVILNVNDDFCVTYYIDKGSFTEALITSDN